MWQIRRYGRYHSYYSCQYTLRIFFSPFCYLWHNTTIIWLMYLTILFLDRITLIQQFSVRSLFIKRNTGTSARSISYRAPPSAHNSDRKDSPYRIRQDHLHRLWVVVKLAVSVTQIKTNVSIFRFIDYKYNQVRRKTQRHGLKNTCGRSLPPHASFA